MGIIGDLWSIPNTFISAGMASNASSKAYARQLDYMARSAKLNYDYSQQSLRESPTAQRTGLENAGYNPMLAVQNATGGANANFANSTGVNMDEIAGITSANATSAQAFNSMENLDKQTESNVDLQGAQKRKFEAEASSAEINNKYLDDRSKKELGKLDAETTKLNRETSYYDALEENMLQERKLQELGIYSDVYARKYSADRGFAGIVYNANTNERNNIRSNRTTRGRIGGPFGMSGYIGQFNDFYQDYYDMLPHNKR